MVKRLGGSRPISPEEFHRRLVALCLGGIGPGLPRKRRDAHILLKALALLFTGEKGYSESEVNGILEAWRKSAGPGVEIDRVSLRRHLVDDGYLVRDAGGNTYRVVGQPAGVVFEPGVEKCDPLRVIQEARERAAQRRLQRPVVGKGGRQHA